jgi:hypothetical protein
LLNYRRHIFEISSGVPEHPETPEVNQPPTRGFYQIILGSSKVQKLKGDVHGSLLGLQHRESVEEGMSGDRKGCKKEQFHNKSVSHVFDVESRNAIVSTFQKNNTATKKTKSRPLEEMNYQRPPKINNSHMVNIEFNESGEEMITVRFEPICEKPN